MIPYGLIIGERLSFLQSIGVAFAVSGLVMLMLPSVGAPPLFYGFLMIVSGIAWSAYSVAGRGSRIRPRPPPATSSAPRRSPWCCSSCSSRPRTDLIPPA